MKFIKTTEISKIGETRITRKFAWLPCRVVNGWVWLGYVEVLEVYRIIFVVDGFMNNEPVLIQKKAWDVVETRSA